MSYQFKQGLFEDFEVDSVLVIKNPARFENLIARNAAHRMPPHKVGAGKVEYFDPFDGPGNQYPNVNPLFQKNSQFSYQAEIRIVWVPNEDRGLVENLDIELGPLTGLAELWSRDELP